MRVFFRSLSPSLSFHILLCLVLNENFFFSVLFHLRMKFVGDNDNDETFTLLFNGKRILSPLK